MAQLYGSYIPKGTRVNHRKNEIMSLWIADRTGDRRVNVSYSERQMSHVFFPVWTLGFICGTEVEVG